MEARGLAVLGRDRDWLNSTQQQAHGDPPCEHVPGPAQIHRPRRSIARLRRGPADTWRNGDSTWQPPSATGAPPAEILPPEVVVPEGRRRQHFPGRAGLPDEARLRRSYWNNALPPTVLR